MPRKRKNPTSTDPVESSPVDLAAADPTEPIDSSSDLESASTPDAESEHEASEVVVIEEATHADVEMVDEADEAPPSDEEVGERDAGSAAIEAVIETVDPESPIPDTENPDGAPLELAGEMESMAADIVDTELASLLATPLGLRGAVEAVLFCSPEPITIRRICNALGVNDTRLVGAMVQQIKNDYDQQRRGFQVVETASGYQMATREMFGEVILRLKGKKRRPPLSAAALETLAIIAYRQPIIRAEIEAIRGVESSGTIRNLIDMSMVEMVGRKDVLGRPPMYGTTNQFLESFGLRALADLPPIAELKKQIAEQQQKSASTSISGQAERVRLQSEADNGPAAATEGDAPAESPDEANRSHAAAEDEGDTGEFPNETQDDAMNEGNTEMGNREGDEFEDDQEDIEDEDLDDEDFEEEGDDEESLEDEDDAGFSSEDPLDDEDDSWDDEDDEDEEDEDEDEDLDEDNDDTEPDEDDDTDDVDWEEEDDEDWDSDDDAELSDDEDEDEEDFDDDDDLEDDDDEEDGVSRD